MRRFFKVPVSVCVLLLAAGFDSPPPPGGTDANVAGYTMSRLEEDPLVKAALAHIEADAGTMFEEQRALAEIPAPPFAEAERARAFKDRMEAAGFAGARADSEGNIVARFPGAGTNPAPMLVVSAHLDTVFPAETDVTVREQQGTYYGPGLADNARGLSVLLGIARALKNSGIRTKGDVMLVATVGEEGRGDLRGVKQIVREYPDMDGFVAIDGVPLDTLTNRATGSRRWAIRFIGPGGHSFVNFGRPSAVHAMGRAIASIAEMRPPPDPRTTFTVGLASGGTSVNAIASEAEIQIDLRSDDARELERLEAMVKEAASTAVASENARWNSDALRWEQTLIGDRPGGVTLESSPIVQASLAAAKAAGGPAPRLITSSTDSNVPMALGIPAVTLRGGGEGGDMHGPGEWYRPTNAWIGAQRVFLTILALVGVEGLTEPLLTDRANMAGQNH